MRNTTTLALFAALGLVTLLLACLGLYLMIAADRPATGGFVAASQSSATTFTAPFTLTNQNGEPVTEKTYLGKPTLYFFGFTHCPDVCPTTLTALTNWLNTLGSDAQKLNVVFISVDPERDTPATLKTYIANFHPVISAATGTEAQLQAVAREFMVYYARVPEPTASNPNDYTMSHSSMILMADRNGTFMGTLDAHDPDAIASKKLHELLN